MARHQTALKLWVVLSRAQAAVSAHAEADAVRHGLSLAEFGALEALFSKGPLLVGDLQRKVLKSSGGITYVVDRLQDKGLVRRRPCEEDRRAIYAELTDEGAELMARIFPLHEDSIEAATSGLTPEEQRQAIALLKKLGHSAMAAPKPEREGAGAAG
ncbi:MAG: MarR family transcriptional regulator [Gemmatimonadota bacterium]|jgi:MarR family 2-MHQ and catechol resistance regulon transcriptional repressor